MIAPDPIEDENEIWPVIAGFFWPPLIVAEIVTLCGKFTSAELTVTVGVAGYKG